MSDEIKDSAAKADVKKMVKKEISKQMGDVWAVLKGLKKAAEIHWGIDIDKDGKVGSTRIAASLWVFALFTLTVFATSDIVVWYNADATKGTAKIVSDDAGAATLTVDKVVAASGVTGPIVGDVTGNVTLSGGTIEGTQTSGTSKYNIEITPTGSTAGFNGRVDGLHLGTEDNCLNTSNAFVAAYFSAGRGAAHARAAVAGWPSGSPDTAVRAVVINKATNDATQYSIRGAYVKAKNYTGGVVKGVQGLWVEAVNDGTDTAGYSSVIALGTDSSTVDYGIDMNEMATPAQGEIRFSNGLKLRCNTTNLFVVTADDSQTNYFAHM